MHVMLLINAALFRTIFSDEEWIDFKQFSQILRHRIVKGLDTVRLQLHLHFSFF
jgi:hypothetical protein